MAIHVRNKQGVMETYKIVGLKGENGVTPNISVGTVTTLEAGEKATVVNSGTLENPVFDFGIPKGADGAGGSDSSASIDDSTISKNKTWSSSKIEDFVLTNNNTIWKDVNGENLKIENTKEGYLREVEIWGNTIQNQDDLSDIKHLGELYVDDNGKPKPDSQGRNQYKIDIESDYRMFDGNVESGRELFAGGLFADASCTRTKNLLLVEVGDIISSNLDYAVCLYSGSKKFLGTNKVGNMNGGYIKGDLVIPSGVSYVRVYWWKPIDEFMNLGVTLKNTSDKSFKTTILLPCQLMKVGKVADRLYWDGSKGRYVIEKYIKTTNLPVIENIETTFIDGDKGAKGRVDFKYEDYNDFKSRFEGIPSLETQHIYNGDYICIHGVKSLNHYSNTWFDTGLTGAFLSFHTGGAHIELHFRNTNCNDIEEMNNWMKSFSNSIAYYRLKAPQLIETNITEELKLPTYINNTYISVSGGIDGSIKAKAPVDGGKVIATLQMENIELKATNDTQDELINTTMLATDEMFMMLEPLLAELLTNEKSSSKIVDMYVAMVQREIKTIENVPVRYREQVKEILDKLEK